MKAIDRVKTSILNIRKSIERFPITIAVSVLLTILLIYFNENSSIIPQAIADKLMRINMTVGLGVLLSLAIGLLNERFFDGKIIGYIWYVIGAALLVIYFRFFLNEFEMVQMTRFIGTVIFLIIIIFYALKLKHDLNYEAFVINMFTSVFITLLYCGVLFGGLSAIVFTIDQLFDVMIEGKVYFYMFLIVGFIFGVSMFLSKIPEKVDEFKDYQYSKSLKVLLIYIVIPLITVYTIILYAYFVKILVSWEWPQGLVSNLVLWYSAISVGVIFFITPLLEENKIAKLFKIWFPKFILPIMVMMFMSIYQRINQYGVTENRYYIVLFGLWILGIMLYFSFKKPLKNIIIPISLSIVVLLSIYGPISSYSISKSSQNNRLVRLLESNGMLTGGVITASPNLSKDAKDEINNIISYFERNHLLEDIKVLPDDFKLSDMKDKFGFAYEPFSPGFGEYDRFNYYSEMQAEAIDISEYDYYIKMSSWENKIVYGDAIEIQYNKDNTLRVEVVGLDVISVDFNDIAKEIKNKKNTNEGKDIIDTKDMTIEIGKNNINMKLIFTSLYGRIDMNNGELIVEGADFLLFIDRK